MKIVRGLNALKRPAGGSVATIGVFDGVHIGHRDITSRVVGRARRLNIKSVVITFDPHPMKVLHPRTYTPSIMSLDHRIRLIGELGVDILVVARFTGALAGLSPEAFVKRILIGKAGAREVHVSDNFYFGKGASAGVGELKRLGRRFGCDVKVARPVRRAGKVASSSLIRRLITAGKLREAARFLGRPVSILGTVVSGARLGRELGYPTANINPHHEAIPPTGVYAVIVRFKDRLYRGVLNIGVRPTFYAPRDREPEIEVHLFGFKSRIYGKDLEVFFIRKLREEMAFEDKRELVRQIKRDEKAARASLGRAQQRKIIFP